MFVILTKIHTLQCCNQSTVICLAGRCVLCVLKVQVAIYYVFLMQAICSVWLKERNILYTHNECTSVSVKMYALSVHAICLERETYCALLDWLDEGDDAVCTVDVHNLFRLA